MAKPNSRGSRPLASFTRLSPSSKCITRCGKPSFRPIDVAAIASVVETTARSTKAAFQSKPGKNFGAR